MNCSICNKKIELFPSAAERAKKYGGNPSDYTRLFTEHAACVINKRREETTKLIKELSR